jgi:hypothetical protein
VWQLYPAEKGFGVDVREPEAVAAIRGMHLPEIPSEVGSFSFGIESTTLADDFWMGAALDRVAPARDRWNGSFWLGVDLSKWANLWSFAQLVEQLGSHDEPEGLRLRPDEDHHVLGPGILYFDCQDPDPTDNVDAYVRRWQPRLERRLAAAQDEATRSARRDAVITFFDFPAPVSTACQQYLLYFVQFLKDLGIDADAEVKESARRVLFSVTPTTEGEGLDRIREALQAYLALPYSRSEISGTDIAVQQLRANVLHLRGQLEIASAVVEAKNATIAAQAISIAQFQNRQLLLTAPGSANAVEREDIIPDAVAVTKIHGKGFEIDLPAIVRKLKRRL